MPASCGTYSEMIINSDDLWPMDKRDGKQSEQDICDKLGPGELGRDHRRFGDSAKSWGFREADHADATGV